MTVWYRNRWKRWATVFGVLTAIALLAATQLTIRSGNITWFSWVQLFLVQLAIWNVWGILTPLIFKMAGIISKSRNRFKIALFHVPVSLVVVALFLFVYSVIFILFSGSGIEDLPGIFMALIISSFHWFMILYWITVGFEYYLRKEDHFRVQEVLNAQLENQLTEAQLKALKMQLNPHFLFNSLNTISGLVRTDEKKKSVAMLARLSDFLREVLVDRGNQEITLTAEISYVKKYLEIEQLRFSNKLTVAFDIDPEVEDCHVPGLILQPLVENAIKHGISRRKEAGLLKIYAGKEGRNLCMSVYNDGRRLDESANPAGKGVGLTNTLKRLERSYGKNQSFEILNRENGVEVRLKIPLQHPTEKPLE